MKKKHKQNKKGKYIKVCPECGSDNLTTVDYPQVSSPMLLGAKCMKCGHKGNYLEVQESNLDKFRKKLKSHAQPHTEQKTSVMKLILNPIVLTSLFGIIVSIILVIIYLRSR